MFIYFLGRLAGVGSRLTHNSNVYDELTQFREGSWLTNNNNS